MRHLGLALAVLAIWASCVPFTPLEENDKLLAKVFDKKLYLSDLEALIPDGMSSNDSLLWMNAAVNRWAKEAVLLREAEQNVPEDWNIDELVQDYRASLIRYNYQQALVEQRLDSTITPQELRQFYDRNKEQYELETPIVRCNFIKVPRSANHLDSLRQWWDGFRGDTMVARWLIEYCNLHAEAHVLEDSTWHAVEELAAAMPKGTLTPENIRNKKEFTQRDEYYEYYFRVFEVVNKKEIAPLSYIEGQARRVILKQRKETLVEETKRRMFTTELERNNVAIYTD